MSKIIFTDEQVAVLKEDQYVEAISTIKDGATKEILAHYVSDNLKLDISLQTSEILMHNNRDSLQKDSFIHYDQCGHNTSPNFRNKLREFELGQSMSMHGN